MLTTSGPHGNSRKVNSSMTAKNSRDATTEETSTTSNKIVNNLPD
jgi:hypothetical protein